VVVADDYPIVKAGLRAMLRAPDIRVLGEAASAEELIRLTTTLGPDVVLIGLPFDDTDGLDLLRRLKDSAPKVSIIIRAQATNVSFLSRALALGCSGHLDRRAGRAELLDAVRRIAKGECIVKPDLLRELLKEVSAPAGGGAREPSGPLTKAERAVLLLITEGRTNREIGQRLHYSVGTVKDYVQRVIQKLAVSDRTQAAVKAVRLGLVD